MSGGELTQPVALRKDVNGPSAAKVSLGLGRVAHETVKRSQRFYGGCDLNVVGPERPLRNSQGAPQFPLGLGVALLRFVECAEVV